MPRSPCESLRRRLLKLQRTGKTKLAEAVVDKLEAGGCPLPQPEGG